MMPKNAAGGNAAKWRSFDQTVRKVREAFSDLSCNDLRKLIDEAIADVRLDAARGRRTKAVEHR
jgi:hypothetical protein